jgi:hypothetical protein
MQVYLRDMLSHWAGLWALCPQEQYDKARSVCFPAGGKNAAEKKLVASLDQYHKIQGGIKTTIQNMQKAGVGFGVLSLYGRQNTPIHARADLWQADGIIDTRYTGGFPRLASVEPGAAGLPGQEKDAKHDHLSGDGMVDASVCWFPENTWFIHGLEHSSYHDGEDPSLWVAWLADGGCRKGVTGDKNHPQFTKYNEATGKLTGNM